ncbi:Nif3-like dinuclear metal center hexameric protein [Deinococcus sp.]|uniref:Nif3-like dinuclear metal center hexameric protein n=1 Tax=Deinococcus sp. TaxID=47478 RepID=UPI003C7AD207
MPTLPGLADWCRTRLGEASIVWPAQVEVGRLALALDPGDLPASLEADALFLHRSHRLGEALPGLGVLASHDGFDAALTSGQNWALARALAWQDAQALTLERAAGLLARPPQTDWARLLNALSAEFGGHEALLKPKLAQVSRLAFVNAMRPETLDAVAGQGVQVYVTGQMRPAALPEARRLGLGVIALGHRRSELWGLRRLAHELEASFPDLSCKVYGKA